MACTFEFASKRELAVAAAGRELAVLGHYPAYRRVADDMKAHHFDLGDAARWLTSAERWRHNEAFLDSIIACGGRFLLATPPKMARNRSNYQLELRYLYGKGYRLERCLTPTGYPYQALVPA